MRNLLSSNKGLNQNVGSGDYYSSQNQAQNENAHLTKGKEKNNLRAKKQNDFDIPESKIYGNPSISYQKSRNSNLAFQANAANDKFNNDHFNSSSAVEPSHLEFKLEKLLIESAQREKNYQCLIKKIQQDTCAITESYITTLRQYKQELDSYKEQKEKKKKQKLFEKFSAKNKVIFNSGQRRIVNKFQKTKLEYLPKPYLSSNPTSNFISKLKCFLTVKYFSPILQDFLRQRFPTDLLFQISLPIKQQFLAKNQHQTSYIAVTVHLDEDESENIDNLINNYPFQLYQTQKDLESGFQKNISFTLSSNQPEVIDALQRGKIWLSVYDKKSLIQFAYGSVSGEQFLYYSSQSTFSDPGKQEWDQAFELYSFFTHKHVCDVHLSMQNQPVYSQSQSTTDKIQSNEPLQLVSLKVQQNIYGDKESRMIQRINKYKTINNSLLMSADPSMLSNSVADKQRLAQSSNDKTLLSHMKRKQIESINRYKQQHKKQFISKILLEAQQIYSLKYIEPGVPVFLVFYFQKPTFTSQKVLLISEISNCFNTKNQTNASCQAQMINSKDVINRLISQNLISIKNGATIKLQEQYSQKKGIYIDEEISAFVFKIFLTPASKIQDYIRQTSEQPSNSLLFQFKLTIKSDTEETLSEQVYLMSPIRSSCIDYELTFHNYQQETQQIEIPLNIKAGENGDLLRKHSRISLQSSHSIQYNISEQLDVLTIKAAYKKVPTGQFLVQQIQKSDDMEKASYLSPRHITKEIDIVLLDHGHNFVLGRYRIKLISYHKMKVIQNYRLGEICQYKFPFVFENGAMGRVGFYTSHQNQCQVLCQGKSELLCQKNKIYQVEVSFQTFESKQRQERIVIHAVAQSVDSRPSSVLKRWLLIIPKNLVQSSEIHQLLLVKDQLYPYRYIIRNKQSKQCSYRFYSSNISVLSVPESLIVVNPMQEHQINLKIILKKDYRIPERQQNGIQVTMRVQMKSVQTINCNIQPKGWNQTFRLKIKQN